MRRLLVLAAGLLLLTGCSGNGIAPPGPSDIKVDTPELATLKAEIGIEPCEPGTAKDGGLPDIVRPCLGGGKDIDLSTLRGPLVLNFWYAACQWCITEMPALEEFSQKYGSQVPVIGVDSMDQFPEAALELARDTGVTYPLIADPDGDLQDTDLAVTTGYPTSFFLSADGTITSHAGAFDSLAEVVDMVNDQLGLDL